MPLHILTGVRVLLLGARVWSWNEGASVGASVLPPPALALALACLLAALPPRLDPLPDPGWRFGPLGPPPPGIDDARSCCKQDQQ